MALKARGVSEVYVVDIMDKRLEKAMELGATGVINGAKEDVIAKVRELDRRSWNRYCNRDSRYTDYNVTGYTYCEEGIYNCSGWIQQNRRTYTSCKSCTG